MLYSKIYNIINEFNELSYDEKINFLEELISEDKCINNENYLGDRKTFLLKLLKKQMVTSEEEKMYDYISTHFDYLEEKKKEALLRRVYVAVRDGYDRQIQEEKKKYCEEHGHDFSEWEYIPKDSIYHHQVNFSSLDKDGINENVDCWVRMCNCCGFKEISYKNPNKNIISKLVRKNKKC